MRGKAEPGAITRASGCEARVMARASGEEPDAV